MITTLAVLLFLLWGVLGMLALFLIGAAWFDYHCSVVIVDTAGMRWWQLAALGPLVWAFEVYVQIYGDRR